MLTPYWTLGAEKADRLKQAKQEAEKEVKAYKQQREEQYQKRIAEASFLLLHVKCLCCGRPLKGLLPTAGFFIIRRQREEARYRVGAGSEVPSEQHILEEEGGMYCPYQVCFAANSTVADSSLVIRRLWRCCLIL